MPFSVSLGLGAEATLWPFLVLWLMFPAALFVGCMTLNRMWREASHQQRRSRLQWGYLPLFAMWLMAVYLAQMPYGFGILHSPLPELLWGGSMLFLVLAQLWLLRERRLHTRLHEAIREPLQGSGEKASDGSLSVSFDDNEGELSLATSGHLGLAPTHTDGGD